MNQPHNTSPQDFQCNPTPYDAHPLQLVFDQAIGRAPGCGETFMEQDWHQLAAVHGAGALTGLAQQSLNEALQHKENGDIERWEEGMLAAINGLAMAVVYGHATCAAVPLSPAS